jgi:hypothetical protein
MSSFLASLRVSLLSSHQTSVSKIDNDTSRQTIMDIRISTQKQGASALSLIAHQPVIARTAGHQFESAFPGLPPNPGSGPPEISESAPGTNVGGQSQLLK